MERTINISINCKGKTAVNGWTSYKTPQQATILLEHVSGYPSLVSKSIQDELVKYHHRVCMYDRPGYMLSPQGYAPISPVTLERALSSALRIAGEEGPFYLVGHHTGAEYSQIFANINYDSVVGMSFIYPTYTALVGLLNTNQTESIRLARAQAMTDGSLLPDTNLALQRLNFQRALAALGTWMTSPPALSDTSSSSQNLTEWALSSPYLAQAQFFELSMQPQLAEIISDMKPPLDTLKRLPIKLFGVSPERSTQEEYKMATNAYFKVDISDPDNLQPLSLRRVAQEISLHISQLHLF
ncbi:hypothetical protein IWW36_004487 [Coemansia brasiliensis]|uniref:AB hydrolase-1 domain-containing protein n=1 Tax=Coemansia brasiliensis TaxID=2650707 RepID=A0A9W8I880_9FUNG|nr:hypothetical protein IWW36_004487 [Coemansia brasiliensis]